MGYKLYLYNPNISLWVKHPLIPTIDPNPLGHSSTMPAQQLALWSFPQHLPRITSHATDDWWFTLASLMELPHFEAVRRGYTRQGCPAAEHPHRSRVVENTHRGLECSRPKGCPGPARCPNGLRCQQWVAWQRLSHRRVSLRRGIPRLCGMPPLSSLDPGSSTLLLLTVAKIGLQRQWRQWRHRLRQWHIVAQFKYSNFLVLSLDPKFQASGRCAFATREIASEYLVGVSVSSWSPLQPLLFCWTAACCRGPLRVFVSRSKDRRLQARQCVTIARFQGAGQSTFYILKSRRQ